jgi:hypothetical protein
MKIFIIPVLSLIMSIIALNIHYNQQYEINLLDEYMIGNKQAEDIYNYCEKNNDPKKYYNCLEYFNLEF